MTKQKQTSTLLSTMGISQALGVKQRRVGQWIRSGWLKGEKVAYGHYVVDPVDLVRFLEHYGAMLSGINPNEQWKEAVARGQKIRSQTYSSGQELGKLIGIAPEHLRYMRKWRGFPTPVLFPTGGCGCMGAYYRNVDVYNWLVDHELYDQKGHARRVLAGYTQKEETP